jgi:hypothetical protein
MFDRCDAARSIAKASSGVHLDSAIRTPFACSMTGMLSSRASKRSYAASVKISGSER